MSASDQAIETRIVKAFAHPLRFRILQLLNEREASPSALAQQLDEPLGNVSYHVKILREADAIELVRTRPVRGAIEHVYRATARPYFDDAAYAALPASFRNEMIGSTLQELWGHLLQAARAGDPGPSGDPYLLDRARCRLRGSRRAGQAARLDPGPRDGDPGGVGGPRRALRVRSGDRTDRALDPALPPPPRLALPDAGEAVDADEPAVPDAGVVAS